MTALPETMKAAVTHDADDIRVEEVPLPDYEPDDVLVRVEMCGICGTDLHILSGHMRPLWPPHYPFIQGHEWCGTVAALGRNVKRDLKVGDRVIAEPTIGCGQCTRCIRGDYHLCEAAGKDIEGGYRLLGHSFNGAFSEYGVAPPNNLHPIPDSMSWQEGVIVNQVVVAMHALDRGGRVEPAGKVAITGPGLLGLCVLQVARHYGASRTYITGRGPRLEVAKELGADFAIDITREDPVRIVMDDTGGVGADLVVECSGSPEAILQAIGMVKRGGRVVLEGITGGKEIPVNTDRLILDEISLLGARGSPNCYPPSIQLIADGAVNARRMLTHEFPLEEIGRAMEMFKKREGNPLRVAVKP
ncbi:MAG: alcohol dehydrogenase catalytic domain-containing protein [Nitrospinota bacterium]|nr:alcohol dehydrogenase catalytic domain-containing protein [Nitrospinota bacterium]